MSANRVTSAGTALVLTAFAFAAGAAAQAPDPSCARGIATGAFCCPLSCGTCGGAGCGARPGGSAMCCGGDIASSNRSCAAVGAPCSIAPPPAPATACGDFPATPSAGRKNVMLIGDSLMQHQFAALLAWQRRSGVPLRCQTVEQPSLTHDAVRETASRHKAIDELLTTARYDGEPQNCVRPGLTLMARRLNLLPAAVLQLQTRDSHRRHRPLLGLLARRVRQSRLF